MKTDHGELSLQLKDCVPNHEAWSFETDFASLRLSLFSKGGSTAYAGLTLKCKEPLTLYEIALAFPSPQKLQELIFYKSFIDAPAVGFLRTADIGYYVGAENPFFTVEERAETVTVAYPPSLILASNEEYESDAWFLGSYTFSGEKITEQEAINLEAFQCGRSGTRFFNPCGEIPLDRSEIQAMRGYVLEYYNVIRRGFDHILYYFFYPHRSLPKTQEDEKIYFGQIDRFKKLQGDLIVFNPLVQTEIPTEEKPYWELLPKGSSAERIQNYATKHGMRCGYYMGCAFHGNGGNAALLPFMPHKTEWKKRDRFGNIAPENCLACNDYCDWWFRVQENTIEKYNLGYWAWDPGPGNGNDCYAQNHGHLPGKGEYKGWRNSMELLKRLKERFPDLFLQSFYGRKEYGIWGFRYFSQQEVYWEQTLLYGATLHNDFSDDRINAHGIRLQNLWSMNHRFLPAHIGHGLITRMGESYYDPDLDHAIDLPGWKYAVISAIAYCGSITRCNLPDRLEHLPEAEAFFRKWVRWAKKNYKYCDYAIPLSNRVGNGTVDGIARIHKAKGQIFLFNPSPQALKKQIQLTKELGLDTNREFYFKLLYCDRMELGTEPINYRGAFRLNDLLSITVPPYSAIVLELASQPAPQRIEKIPPGNHTIGCFALSNGEPFPVGNHSAYSSVTLHAKAYISQAVLDALQKVPVPNRAMLENKINNWRADGMPFTFLTSFPHRLLLYLPIAGVHLPKSIALRVNGEQVPVERFCLNGMPVAHYAFIESHVLPNRENTFEIEFTELHENSFMGCYLEFPDVPNGVQLRQSVLEENSNDPRSFHDPALVINSFTITPNPISNTNCEIEVTVRTDVPPQTVHSIRFLHPTQPQMPALRYLPQENCWRGVFQTGDRKLNIFCNSRVFARIQALNGGIGPKKYLSLETIYSPMDHKSK